MLLNTQRWFHFSHEPFWMIIINCFILSIIAWFDILGWCLMHWHSFNFNCVLSVQITFWGHMGTVCLGISYILCSAINWKCKTQPDVKFKSFAPLWSLRGAKSCRSRTENLEPCQQTNADKAVCFSIIKFTLFRDVRCTLSMLIYTPGWRFTWGFVSMSKGYI